MKELFTNSAINVSNQLANIDGAPGDIVNLVATILLWTIGYLAAPIVFVATLGVFRNLAGMGTGVFKGLSGKIRAPGKEARGIGKSPTKELKQMKRQELAYGRRARTRQAIGGSKKFATGDFKEGRKEMLGAASPAQSYRRNRSRAELKEAFYSANASQRDPSVQAGHLTKQAAEIEAGAGVINADMEYTVKFNELTADGSMSAKDARDEALNHVAQKLQNDLSDGTATQSQVTGTLTYLGQNKAVDQLNNVQEHIGTLSGEKGVKATQQYGSALGNSNAYGALTSLNAGYKNIPSSRGSLSEDQAKAQVKAARARAMVTEQPGKVAGSDAKSWTEAAEFHPDEVAKRLGQLNAMGGTTAQGLQIPTLPKDAAGNVNTGHENYTTIKNLHDEIMTSPDPEVQALTDRLN